MGLFKDVSDGYVKESTHVYVEPKRCRHTEVEIVAKDPCGLVAVEWCPEPSSSTQVMASPHRCARAAPTGDHPASRRKSEMSKTHVSSNQDHVSVMYVERRRPAVAEADWLGDHWWVARVQVPTEMGRGRGIGTKVMGRMLEEIQKQRPASTVVVAPGGYGESPAKQRRFYERCGFSAVAEGWLEMQVGDRNARETSSTST